MYKTQLKKWGLSKNMKAAEKDRIIHTIEEQVQNQSSTGEFLELGEKEVEKLLRHLSNKSSSQSPTITTKRTLIPDNVREYSLRLDTSYSPSSSLFLYLASFNSPTSHGSVDMRLIFSSLQASCAFPVTEYNPSSAATKSFWTNVKQSIYLLRISSKERAWPTLDKACHLAEEAVLTTDPCTFVREILETLSPSNTKESPAVRLHLLCFLADMARIKLPYNHPTTIILQQLCYDSDNRDVSERCLAYMTETLENRNDRKEVMIRAQLGISRLLRKDEEYDSALIAAGKAHTTSVRIFGPNSLQACWALRQKEHIYIDQENYPAALETCFEIIGQAKTTVSNFDPVSHTQCAIYTMEDIAYVFEKLGNIEARLEWLTHAKAAAECLWGDSVATSHITDKLLAVKL